MEGRMIKKFWFWLTWPRCRQCYKHVLRKHHKWCMTCWYSFDGGVEGATFD